MRARFRQLLGMVAILSRGNLLDIGLLIRAELNRGRGYIFFEVLS